jgi:hypothetical protein
VSGFDEFDDAVVLLSGESGSITSHPKIACDISADDGGLHQEDETLPLKSITSITTITTTVSAVATGDPTSSMIVINEDVSSLVSCYSLIMNHNLNNLLY